MKLLVLLILLTVSISNVVLSTLSSPSTPISLSTSDRVYVNFVGGYLTSDCSGEPETQGYSFNINNGYGACIEFGDPLSWTFNITKFGGSFDWVVINENRAKGCEYSDNKYSVMLKPGCNQLPNFHNSSQITYGILSITPQPVLSNSSVVVKQFTDSSCSTPYIYTSYPQGYTWSSSLNAFNYESTYYCDSNNQPFVRTCFRGSCNKQSIASSCSSIGRAVYCN